MSLRSSAFGWRSVWLTLAAEFGGEVDDHDAGTNGRLMVRIPLGKTNWQLTYQAWSTSQQDHRASVSLPFKSDRDFTFSVSNRNWLGDTLKVFGMQDIIVGDKDFDRDYYIQGSDVALVRELFQSEELKELIGAQRSMRLEIRKTPASDSSHEVHMLYFEVHETIESYERLRAIHDLISCAIEELCHLKVASRTVPQLSQAHR